MIKKLKMSPPGMSYDEVRARQNKKEPDGPASPPETTDEPISKVLSDEIKPASVEPASENYGQRGSDGDSMPPSSTTETDNTVPDESTAKGPVPASQTRPEGQLEPIGSDTRTRPEKVTIKGYAAQPARGVSPTYDATSPIYGEKAALKHLLDLALNAFQELVATGDVGSIQIEPTYASMPKKHQVTRKFSSSNYAILEKKIDPRGILKPGTIGRTIVQAALNHFISNERAPKP